MQREPGPLVDLLADVALPHDTAPAQARASATPEEGRFDTRAEWHIDCVKMATLRRCSVSASNGLVSSSISANHASAAASAGASSSLVPTSSPRLRMLEANESTIRASKRANPAVYPPSSHSRCESSSAPRGPHASWYQVPLAWHVEVTLPANCAEGGDARAAGPPHVAGDADALAAGVAGLLRNWMGTLADLCGVAAGVVHRNRNRDDSALRRAGAPC